MRQRRRGRATLAAVAAMCAVAALPVQAHAAGEPAPYTFAPEAKTVGGAEVSTDASELTPGSVYKSSIKPGEKLYYRLVLDTDTNAYVSAVAVPALGGQVAYGDGITVSIRDSTDLQCSSEDARFESAEFPHPIAAYAYRVPEKDSTTCSEAGTYNVLVERESKATSSQDAWDLELRYESEPKLKEGGPAPTEAPKNWPSASPAPLTQAAQERTGGTSYYDATSLETGKWKDGIEPGQTHFYRVPVDWGQQIFASVDLGNSVGGSNEYIGSALALSLDNPAHGHVDEASPLSYSGKPASVSLDPLPPVAHENRFASSADVSAMRFAGWYYLSVSLSPEVEKAYGKKAIPMTLTVKVENSAGPSPYEGSAGVFGVTQDDKDMARSGQSAPQAAKSDTMNTVAAAGIGTGTVLVVGLGAWTLIARRRAASAAGGPTATGAAGHAPYGGPPQAW
ncbi:hypothetical protein [Streptomyces sp. NBC_00316]|uniref:hypothetical protein n=1 Tax=Streptomyces sp. NBC_00316 TaxID=2975710 RepID=UPI002E2C2F9D|nr:hypothetical protein [Streptomyces sp. NBC_00316]